MSRPTCKIDECGSPYYARGLCHKHYDQWWRGQNPQKAAQYARKYYHANPEKHRKAVHRWQLANSEKEQERKREYYLANSEKVKQATREWKLANPESEKARLAKRRARRANTLSNLTPQEINSILSQGCFFVDLGDCKSPLTLAHNIPVSKGGNTTIANIFCLCHRHNSQMGTKSLSEMLTQLELF